MQVTLVPTAGLCNRINAILSAVAVHKIYHTPIRIFWEKTADCYAEYDELFDPIQIDGLTVASLRKFMLKPGGKKYLYLPELLRKFTFDVSYDGNDTQDCDFSELSQGHNNIYVHSYNRFCRQEETEEPISNYFKPIREIARRIETVTKEFPENTIGIHIRQTDNLASIRNNPIEKFTNYMDAEIKKDPACKFYLATDSPEIKERLIQSYADRILFSDNDLARSTTKGMQDAVTELYCLGNTRKIIGCTNSSYSVVAARLYNIPLIL